MLGERCGRLGQLLGDECPAVVLPAVVLVPGIVVVHLVLDHLKIGQESFALLADEQ